jgi:hypothetical protein
MRDPVRCLPSLIRALRASPRSRPAARNGSTSDKSNRGYLLSQFELAWCAYCFTGDTPAQPSEIMALSGP